MAPLVVKGRVLIGNSGGEYGVRGWLVALDAQKGKELWRAYSTGPDRDVLIGPGYKPFYAKDRGADLGVKTWPSDAWKIGGGTVWGWISYDADLDLVYYGTSNPGPWNPEQRPGDNKFTSGLFARDASTGQARWFYQLSPHDQFDYDAVNESVLVDLVIDGKPRKVLVHPDRNGYVYVMDRATGEVLSATPFVSVNTSTGVDLETGLAALRVRPSCSEPAPWCATSVPPRRAARTGSRPRIRRARSCSTSRTRISARTRRPRRRATSPGRRMSGRSSR